MANTWFTHIKDKKLHYVPSLRYHSNKNIKSSVNLPINVIFEAICVLSARIHPNNSYKFKICHICYNNARNKK